MLPGEFKVTRNVAGNTTFVEPRLVVGTLREAGLLLHDVDAGLPRALLAMFIVSEVHPFNDGNGRIARAGAALVCQVQRLEQVPQALQQEVGSYRLGNLIGRGGMGVVYLAEDDSLQRQVAVKTLLLPDDPQDRKHLEARFRQEAKAAGGLNHPNIITIHDIGTMDSGSYIVMELVDGKTLRELALAEAEGIDLAASWAYSDSASDLPMLRAVGNPVAVNGRRLSPANSARRAIRLGTSTTSSARR